MQILKILFISERNLLDHTSQDYHSDWIIPAVEMSKTLQQEECKAELSSKC